MGEIIRWRMMVLILLTVSIPIEARCQFEICNDWDKPTISAIAYETARDQYRVAGWYEVNPDTCVIVAMRITTRTFFVFTQNRDGARDGIHQWNGKGENLFCTHEEKFDIPAGDPCDGIKLSYVRADIGERTSVFQFRITKDGVRLVDAVVDPPPPPPPDPSRTTNTCRGYTSFTGPIPCPPTPSEKPEWQKHLDWSIKNSDAGGSVDCPLDYPYSECILSGGRACLMRHAKQSARDHDCANALRVALVTQCHNPEARQRIAQAGEYAVCQYLGPPDPPKPPPPAPPPPGSSSDHPVTFVNQSDLTLYTYYFVVEDAPLVVETQEKK